MTGAALVPRLLTSEYDVCPGTLAIGEAKAGQNPPYLLEDPTPDETKTIGELFQKFADEDADRQDRRRRRRVRDQPF